VDAHVAAETAVRRHEMGGIADEEGAPLRQKHRGREAYQSAAHNENRHFDRAGSWFSRRDHWNVLLAASHIGF
jgi:hypothetical protein